MARGSGLQYHSRVAPVTAEAKVVTESGTVSINILSGLEAISLDNTVNEEEPTVLRLWGYNAREQPPAVGFSTTFVLESLPSHGTLYQYAAAAPDNKGALITADMLPVNVTDEPWNDQANPQCCSDNGVTFHNEVTLDVQDTEEWYYMNDINEQTGPVSRAEIKTLFNDGVVYEKSKRV